MMRKFHEAKRKCNVRNWGSGTPMRIFVDDMAQAVVFALEKRYGLFIQRRDRRRFDHQTIG
jgi:nucleoside-diphosphate-sugar epimerase